MNGIAQKDKHVADANEVEPKVLYKYGKFDEYTERRFTHNELFFSSPYRFNDPFDSKVVLRCDGKAQQKEEYLCAQYKKKQPTLSEEEIRAHVHGREEIILNETLEKARDRLRNGLDVCCFTERRDDILMWAHYAGQHTGFCLEFDADNEFFARALRVKYGAIRAIINVLSLDSLSEGEVAKKLLIKARDWKHEQEWRIVDYGKGEEIQNFPAEALRGVILGCKISPENKENVLKWCSERKHAPTIYQAKEKEDHFGLDIIRINDWEASG